MEEVAEDELVDEVADDEPCVEEVAVDELVGELEDVVEHKE